MPALAPAHVRRESTAASVENNSVGYTRYRSIPRTKSKLSEDLKERLEYASLRHEMILHRDSSKEL